MHFFDLTLDSLTTIEVEPTVNILFTQGPIPEILWEKYCELVDLENSVFLSRPFWRVFTKKEKMLHPHENQSVSWVSSKGG